MTVRLYFLGAPHCERDGQPVDLTSAKGVGLLGYLATAGRPQSRERLLGLLWAESSEEAARKNLRNTLWSIRRSLGDILDVAGAHVALAPTVLSDVAALTAAVESPAPTIPELRAATDLYRGPFLDSINLSEAPEFELWLAGERERLVQLYLRALGLLADLYRKTGSWSDLISVAQQALAHDRLQETAFRLLMEGLARQGLRAEALRQYEVLRTALDQELGVEPLPETERLRAAILSGELSVEPAVSVPAAGQTGARASRPRAAAGGAAAVPFVGRAVERAALDADLSIVEQHQARAILISGEVGIGKSRLWHEWAGHLPPAPERVILETRALEATQALPFAPVAQMFRSPDFLQRAFSQHTRAPRIWLAEVARLVPEIRLAHPDLPAPTVLRPDEERERLFEGLAQCLLALKAQPLIVFLDDAHWADAASLAWLGYLVDRLLGHPLLLVLAYRPEEAPQALTSLAAGWMRQGLARRLSLERLTEEEAALLVRQLGVPPLRAAEIHAFGAGNPFFLVELARAANTTAEQLENARREEPAAIVPPVLGELIQARLERLDGHTRQVLQAAAVLEPDFDFPALRKVSGRDEEETLDALDALLDAGLLVENTEDLAAAPAEVEPVGTGRSGRPDPSGGQGHPSGGAAWLWRPPAEPSYSFAHPLVASVVRSGLSGARRAFLYRRAAQALEHAAASRLPEVAGRLAFDYAQAGDTGRAAYYTRLAADRALSLGAAAEAAALFRQALALEPAPALHLGLGRALVALGDLAPARESIETALAGFSQEGDRLGAAQACLALADTYLPAGRADETLRWAEQSLVYLDAHANPDADPRVHTEAHLLLGSGRMRSGHGLDEAEAQLVEAARLADEKGLADLAARSRFELGTLLAQRGDLEGAVAAFRSAIKLARVSGDQGLLILSYNNLAYHELLLGDIDSALAEITLGLNLDEELALAPPRQYLYSTRGEIALAQGAWGEAESWFERALIEAARQGNREQAASCRANLALVARGRGDLSTGIALLEAARQEVVGLSTPYLESKIELWLAELRHEWGQSQAALEALERAEKRLSGSGFAGLLAWAGRLRQAWTSADLGTDGEATRTAGQ